MSARQSGSSDQGEADLASWELKSTGRRLEGTAGWKRGDPIGYVRQEILDFQVPAYQGESYEALVPDTLDLQERAALAVNALTEPTDPLADYEMYFFGWVLGNPPMMQHSFDSHCMNKFMEALPLMRMVSGSDLNQHVDRRWMEVVLHQQGPDGITYLPIQGRPWAYLGMEGLLPDRAWDLDQFISPLHCGRLLSAITLYQRRDGGTLWREVAERLVDGLADVAVDRSRYAYFAPHTYWAEKGYADDPAGVSGMEDRGAAQGLVDVYRELGYEPALSLAGKLVNHMLEVCRGFDESGRFMVTIPQLAEAADFQPAMPGATHFHMHTGVLHSVLEYARVVGDESLLELVRKGYEYGKANGNVLLGYFPEFVNSPRLEHSELCEVADMIALGLKLTEASVGDYWDDVDRWARNMFAEGQLTRIDWIGRAHLVGPEGTREVDVLPSHVEESYQTTDRVAERNLGAFAGWPKANDWYAGQGMGFMHCCTGNAARAIYYIWENILRHEDGRLRVNLLLNRASPWADVDSHVPYTGQVDVRVKQPTELAIRIPEWVSPGQVSCRVEDVTRSLGWDGRYALVGPVKPGDVATLTFPIEERTNVIYVEKQKYTIVRKGNDVVSIDPPGRYCPLYQRDHYRENATRWRSARRFVSSESIRW